MGSAGRLAPTPTPTPPPAALALAGQDLQAMKLSYLVQKMPKLAAVLAAIPSAKDHKDATIGELIASLPKAQQDGVNAAFDKMEKDLTKATGTKQGMRHAYRLPVVAPAPPSALGNVATILAAALNALSNVIATTATDVANGADLAADAATASANALDLLPDAAADVVNGLANVVEDGASVAKWLAGWI
jgi:hypothetical protein